MGNSHNDLLNSRPVINNNAREETYYEDEINLKGYFDVILKRRKLILYLFLICTVITVLITVLLPKVYKATASIMVMPSRIRSVLSPAQISLNPEKTTEGGYAEQRPTISIPTHKALLKSSVVLERVMDKLKSEGKLDKDLATEELFKKLDVEGTKETNVLQLAAKDKYPHRAKDIVDTWAKEYARYSLELITGEVKGSGEFIFDQFELAHDNLVKAEQVIGEFNVQERLPLMEIELKENQNQLESHYAKFCNLEFVREDKKNKAEQIVKEFDAKEKLELAEIELKENRTQLQAHYAKLCSLEFALKEKKSRLQKTQEDIAAMTQNGIWLGTFDIKTLDDSSFVNQSLNSSQKALRQEVLKAKLEFEESRKKCNSFVNDSRIHLLRDEAAGRKQELLNDKSLLSKIKQLCESTKANLKSKGNLNKIKDFKGPIAENLSDLTMWEILSLAEGYNFFETRRKFLEMKLQQEQTDLKTSEKTLTEYEEKLKTLNETFERAQTNYNFYLETLKALENSRNSHQMEIATIEFELAYSRNLTKELENRVKALETANNEKKAELKTPERNSAELGIANVEFELSYSRDLVKKLEDQVRALKVAINEKKTRSTELNRQLHICQENYDHLSSKIEEARIAKAMELGEVKVISLAFEPKYAVWPRKRQNVAVAGVTSLILGVFLAFFLESWNKEKDINNN